MAELDTFKITYPGATIQQAIKKVIEGNVFTQTTELLFDAQQIDPSGNVTSGNVETGNALRLNVYVTQSGTSTNCVINIYGSPDAEHSTHSHLQTFTLGVNQSAGIGISTDFIPHYLWASASNLDPANQAILSTTAEMFK